MYARVDQALPLSAQGSSHPAVYRSIKGSILRQLGRCDRDQGKPRALGRGRRCGRLSAHGRSEEGGHGRRARLRCDACAFEIGDGADCRLHCGSCGQQCALHHGQKTPLCDCRRARKKLTVRYPNPSRFGHIDCMDKAPCRCTRRCSRPAHQQGNASASGDFTDACRRFPSIPSRCRPEAAGSGQPRWSRRRDLIRIPVRISAPALALSQLTHHVMAAHQGGCHACRVALSAGRIEADRAG